MQHIQVISRHHPQVISLEDSISLYTIPCKTNIQVRDFIPKSDRKQYKTNLKPHQKKRGSLASYYSL